MRPSCEELITLMFKDNLDSDQHVKIWSSYLEERNYSNVTQLIKFTGGGFTNNYNLTLVSPKERHLIFSPLIDAILLSSHRFENFHEFFYELETNHQSILKDAAVYMKYLYVHEVLIDNLSLEDLDFSVRTYNDLKNNGYTDFHSILLSSYETLYNEVDRFKKMITGSRKLGNTVCSYLSQFGYRVGMLRMYKLYSEFKSELPEILLDFSCEKVLKKQLHNIKKTKHTQKIQEIADKMLEAINDYNLSDSMYFESQNEYLNDCFNEDEISELLELDKSLYSDLSLKNKYNEKFIEVLKRKMNSDPLSNYMSLLKIPHYVKFQLGDKLVPSRESSLCFNDDTQTVVEAKYDFNSLNNYETELIKDIKNDPLDIDYFIYLDDDLLREYLFKKDKVVKVLIEELIKREVDMGRVFEHELYGVDIIIRDKDVYLKYLLDGYYFYPKYDEVFLEIEHMNDIDVQLAYFSLLPEMIVEFMKPEELQEKFGKDFYDIFLARMLEEYHDYRIELGVINIFDETINLIKWILSPSEFSYLQPNISFLLNKVNGSIVKKMFEHLSSELQHSVDLQKFYVRYLNIFDVEYVMRNFTIDYGVAKRMIREDSSCFSEICSKIECSKEFIIECLEIDFEIYFDIPEELKENKDVIKTFLEYVPDDYYRAIDEEDGFFLRVFNPQYKEMFSSKKCDNSDDNQEIIITIDLCNKDEILSLRDNVLIFKKVFENIDSKLKRDKDVILKFLSAGANIPSTYLVNKPLKDKKTSISIIMQGFNLDSVILAIDESLLEDRIVAFAIALRDPERFNELPDKIIKDDKFVKFLKATVYNFFIDKNGRFTSNDPDEFDFLFDDDKDDDFFETLENDVDDKEYSDDEDI